MREKQREKVWLEPVAAHLRRERERTGNWPYGLTPERLYKEALLHEDLAWPGREIIFPGFIVFEVKQVKRSEAGFEVSWPIYAYDPQEDTLSIVGEAHEPQYIFGCGVASTLFDILGDRPIKVEPCGEGLFRVSWGNGESAVVRSLEEARPIVRKWAANLKWGKEWDEAVETLLDPTIPEVEYEVLEEDMRSVLREAAADYVEQGLELAWEQMLEEENHKEGREDL